MVALQWPCVPAAAHAEDGEMSSDYGCANVTESFGDCPDNYRNNSVSCSLLMLTGEVTFAFYVHSTGRFLSATNKSQGENTDERWRGI